MSLCLLAFYVSVEGCANSSGSRFTPLPEGPPGQDQKLQELETEIAALDAEQEATKKKNQELEAKLANLESRSRPKAAPKPERPRRTHRPGTPDPAVVYRVDVGNAPIQGSRDALVTIVMWSDFRSRFVRRVRPTLKKIAETYGDEVRLVFKYNPFEFDDREMKFSIAAEAAARQGKFWEMRELLLDQDEDLNPKLLKRWAAKLGLNRAKFLRSLEDPAVKERILADLKQAESLGSTGVPHFFINGRSLSGAQPYPVFKALIDETLASAKQLHASGVKRDEVYASIIEGRPTTPAR